VTAAASKIPVSAASRSPKNGRRSLLKAIITRSRR
jgi:hypothetical protein